jgi:hypothetical protein
MDHQEDHQEDRQDPTWVLATCADHPRTAVDRQWVPVVLQEAAVAAEVEEEVDQEVVDQETQR